MCFMKRIVIIAILLLSAVCASSRVSQDCQRGMPLPPAGYTIDLDWRSDTGRINIKCNLGGAYDCPIKDYPEA